MRCCWHAQRQCQCYCECQIQRRETAAAHLIDASELEVAPEVLLVERLQAGVEEPAQQRTLDLLHDLRPRLLRVVLRHDRAEPVVVEVVLLCELVRRALDELEARGRDAERAEDGEEDVLVVLCAVGDELEGRFEVVEECVDICQVELDFRGTLWGRKERDARLLGGSSPQRLRAGNLRFL